MDRNTVIALVLILVIWLAWPKWMELLYGPQEPAPAQTEAVADTTEAAPPESPWSDLYSDRTAPQLDIETPAEATAPIEQRDITIETDKYTATVSNRGAVLRSWSLKNFETHGGGRIQMIPPDGRGLGLRVGPRDRSTDLSDMMFRVDADRDEYAIAPGDSVTLRFELQLADGRTVYSRMTFLGDQSYIRYDAGVLGGSDFERIMVTWRGEVPSAERDFSTELTHMKALSYVGDALENLNFKGKPDSSQFVGMTDWVGIRNKYFLSAFAPTKVRDRSEVTLYASGVPNVSVDFGWDITPFDVTQTTIGGIVYLGPIDLDELVKIGYSLERAADLGWAIIRPISKGVLWTFLTLNKFIPNYGVIIVLFSILIKVILHPLTKKSYDSMSKMQTLKPKMDELRAKYKDDQQKLNQEMMKLYKEEGFNPLGGCLPMALQMPIIFAIYAVLGNNIEFRQAAFFGWITDLSAPDTLTTLPFSIPFYGDDFNVLPILMAASMFFQQKLMLTDPKQKMLVYIMPVVLLFVFNRLSSGLVLYWFMFNVLSAGHQYWLMQKKKKEKEAAEAVPVPVARRNTAKKRRR